MDVTWAPRDTPRPTSAGAGGVAAAALSLSLEPMGGGRRVRRALVWAVLGLFVTTMAAISIVTGLAFGQIFVGSKEIVIRRVPTGEEVVRGIAPAFRSKCALALMERDLVSFSEDVFLEMWGKPDSWDKKVRHRG